MNNINNSAPYLDDFIEGCKRHPQIKSKPNIQKLSKVFELMCKLEK